ncbi:MAG: Asp23/Gls24 family envelope stress response protein [Clostridiales bacterium]|jgi:uncharacterized alkaline shock family protein YloU|nr:Asp23/Gls24 family envelope stress response protein [Clostridiales bacterium]
MPSKIKNEYGLITIENEVIARVAGVAAMDCYGIVGMAAKNVKDGIVQLLKRESLTKGIKLLVLEEGFVIDVHIIVEYGTNIAAIADSIMNTIKYKVEEFIGIKVARINIFVEGVRVDNN